MGIGLALVLAAPAAAIARPDLVVKSVTVAADEAEVGSTLEATDRTFNRGARRAPRSTTGYWLSVDQARGGGDVPVGSRQVPRLRPDTGNTGSADIQVPAELATGEWYVIACADAAKVIPEAQESNNCRATAAPLQVVPAPPPDTDGDGSPDPQDCAPNDDTIHPGAADLPDPAPPFVDSNCDDVDGNAASAIFVDKADGVDDATCGNVGSPPGHPCATITYGLARATATNRSSLFVARGSYPESLTVVQGRSIYGGYEGCPFLPPGCPWGRGGGVTTIRGAQSSGNQLMGARASNIVTSTKLQLIRIVAPSSTLVGGSVYGMHVTNSPGLTLEAVTIEAGNGNAGASGSSGNDGTPGVNGANGGTGSCPSPPGGVAGGAGGQLFVGADDISGGSGGAGASAAEGVTTEVPGGPGQLGKAGDGSLGGSGGTVGAGGSSGAGSMNGGNGGDGAPGLDGASGTGATNGFGQVVATFWQGFGGTQGQHGGNGGGGGGGGGGGIYMTSGTPPSRRANSGAGGGSGGGGGTAGGGGSAGGGSFGLFIVNSTPGPGPVVTGSEIISGNGGTGGFGGIGGDGADHGGVGGQGLAACPEFVGAGGDGGDGGRGGDGGPGGGGAGGASYAVFASGVTGFDPTAADAGNTLGHGQGGAGGASLGSSGVSGASGNTRINP
jgi:CARDB